MSSKIYVLLTDGKVQEECEFPVWINQPKKPNPDDPYWNADLPPARLPDPGAEFGGIGSGFPDGMDRPILVFQAPLGKLPFPDVIADTRILVMSARAKDVFESIDATAFEFSPTTTSLYDGSAGPEYWLADVTRFLDALDEERSTDLKIVEKVLPYNGRLMRRVHMGFEPSSTVFKSKVIRGHHVFRPAYSGDILLDEFAAEAVIRAKLRGVAPQLIGVTDDR